ncbi:vitamin K epoxide reductase family protein [Microlunatus spumicola]|uniref:Vitamin K epoxide reductase family protein n=1 Tax=Microlunatus spumicola TaxID=81499 RepID=A0ABP6XLZ2_9ACTN
MPEDTATTLTDDPADLDTPRSAGAPGRRTGVLMVVVGTLGLVAAMMLTIDRFRLLEDPSAQLACNLSPFIACGPVMQSKAGALFGFPNPLLGIIGFTLVLTTGAVRATGAALPRWYHRGLQVGVLLAAVFITWLQTQSLYVIGALCLWCMLVWTVTIPLVVVVTLENAATGRLGSGLQPLGARLRPYAVTVTAVWYLVVVAAIGLRFYREFALFWFGVAL